MTLSRCDTLTPNAPNPSCHAKPRTLLSEPFRGTALDLLKHSRNRNRARLGNQHMNVIWHAANRHGVDSEISRNSSHVLPEFFLLIGRNDFAAFFRAENDGYEDVDVGMPHAVPPGLGTLNYRSTHH